MSEENQTDEALEAALRVDEEWMNTHEAHGSKVVFGCVGCIYHAWGRRIP